MTQQFSPTGYVALGGTTTAANVSSRATLSALTLSNPQDGMSYFCVEAGFQAPYFLSLNSGALADGVNVLATTAGGNTRWLKGSLGTGVTASSVNLRGTYAARPAAATVGRLYFTTDTTEVFYDTGAAWVPYELSLPITSPPALGSLLWVNQGAATAMTEGDTIRVTKPETGVNANNRALLIEAVPATPWTWTVALRTQLAPVSIMLGGLVLYEVATTRLIEFALYYNANAVHLEVSKLAAPNAAVGAPYRDVVSGMECVATGMQYFRVSDAGGVAGDLTWSYSSDGVYFQPFERRARNDFFAVGPDRRGIVIDNITNALGLDEATLRVVGWG